jgi:hypothetical protein
MEAKKQSSFIPKQTLAHVARPVRQAHVGVFSVLSVIAFLASAAVAAGTFLYAAKLETTIEQYDTDIQAQKSAFELGLIQEIIRFQKRVEAAQSILGGHVAFSRYFRFLEEATIPSVVFIDLSFGKDVADGSLKVDLFGQAANFAAIAAQSDLFLTRPELYDHTFNNFYLNERGFIDFEYTVRIKPEGIGYQLPQTL